MLELFAAVFHIPEEIERCATWRQQDGVSLCGEASARLYAVSHRMRVGNRQSAVVERCVQFAVVGTEEDDGLAFLLHELVYG